MSENVFTAVLTFSLLAGGTAVLGSEMFTPRQPEKAKAVSVAQGMVRKQTASSAPAVVPPAVMVTASRVAMANRPSGAPRVQ